MYLECDNVFYLGTGNRPQQNKQILCHAMYKALELQLRLFGLRLAMQKFRLGKNPILRGH